MDTTYMCEGCNETATRNFTVPYFKSACDSGCGFARFIRESLIEKLREIPDDAKPDEWGSLDAMQRLAVAQQAGVITDSDIWTYR